MKQFTESALEADMATHFDDFERLSGNKRNGKNTKTLMTGCGEIEITTPPDRRSSFKP